MHTVSPTYTGKLRVLLGWSLLGCRAGTGQQRWVDTLPLSLASPTGPETRNPGVTKQARKLMHTVGTAHFLKCSGPGPQESCN